MGSVLLKLITLGKYHLPEKIVSKSNIFNQMFNTFTLHVTMCVISIHIFSHSTNCFNPKDTIMLYQNVITRSYSIYNNFDAMCMCAIILCNLIKRNLNHLLFNIN